MKRHVFKCKKLGWGNDYEGVWFDADYYTREEAYDQFEKVEHETVKNNHVVPYAAYEYDGQLYYSIRYMGVFDENEMPGDFTNL